MTPKLYYSELSPGLRAVVLTAKAIGLELELVPVDILRGETLTPEFKAMNAQHTIPTLDDNGFCLGESIAICIYLVNKYSKNDALYPKDPRRKVIVDQMLFFSASIIQTRMSAVVKSIMLQDKQSTIQAKIENLIPVYPLLEEFLKTRRFVAGDSITIADFCIVAPVSSITRIVPVSPTKHPRLCEWLLEMEKLSYYYDANHVGSEQLVKLVKERCISLGYTPTYF